MKTPKPKRQRIISNAEFCGSSTTSPEFGVQKYGTPEIDIISALLDHVYIPYMEKLVELNLLSDKQEINRVNGDWRHRIEPSIRTTNFIIDETYKLIRLLDVISFDPLPSRFGFQLPPEISGALNKHFAYNHGNKIFLELFAGDVAKYLSDYFVRFTTIRMTTDKVMHEILGDVKHEENKMAEYVAKQPHNPRLNQFYKSHWQK